MVVTSLAGDRGPAAALHALAAVPDAELFIAGGPPAGQLARDPGHRALSKLAGQLGVTDRVTCTGQLTQSAMPALMRSADVLLNLSPGGPRAWVTIEAMACGVPVIAVSSGAHQDAVLDGTTGYLVASAQPAPLARRIRQLLATPLREGMAIAAASRARDRYSWDRIGTETLAVYETAVRQTAPAAEDPEPEPGRCAQPSRPTSSARAGAQDAATGCGGGLPAARAARVCAAGRRGAGCPGGTARGCGLAVRTGLGQRRGLRLPDRRPRRRTPSPRTGPGSSGAATTRTARSSGAAGGSPATGFTECREALGYPGDPDTAVLLRRVLAVDGPARVKVVLDLRAGFGRHRMTQLRSAAGIWTARSGPLRMRWSGGAGARVRPDGALELILALDAGPAARPGARAVQPAAAPPPGRPGRRLAGHRAGLGGCPAQAGREPGPGGQPAQLRRADRADQPQRGDGGCRHHVAAGTLPGGPQLRLPVRVDPGPVLHRPGGRG